MKKEYDKTKKLVIGGLAIVAVCLVVGLCWYLGTIGHNEAQEEALVETATDDIKVTVPETTVPVGERTDELEETEDSEAENTLVEEDAEQKPQTKEEAQQPESKPEVTDDNAVNNSGKAPQYEPEVTQPQQPQDPPGGTNSGGKIYVPGFGYVDDPGVPAGESAGSDGDWNKQVGDMN